MFTKANDFPGGTVDKTLPANAGDTGSSPSPGRFHVPQMLKPLRPRAGAPQEERPLQGEAYTPQLERSPHSPQRERARKQQRTPRTAKNKQTHSGQATEES